MARESPRRLGLGVDLADVDAAPLGDDGAMAALVAAATAAGRQLRFVTDITLADADGGGRGFAVKSGPSCVDASDPIVGNLQDMEVSFAIYTHRMRDRPIVLRGSGAGESLAGAVMGSLLLFASHLQYR